MKTWCHIPALLILAMFAVSCQEKELCLDHSHIVNLKVDFDWAKAPEANPGLMTLYLFSEDGSNPQRYELNGRNGGTIRVGAGTYHALCLNGDTRNIECRDRENLSSFLITTKDDDLSTAATLLGTTIQSLPSNPMSEDERMAREPEMLWTDRLHEINVERYGENRIEMQPESSVIKISITITNVQNLHLVSGIMGTLSGLSEGILADSGMSNGKCVTTPFAIVRGEDETSLSAEMRSFGDCLSGAEKHFVNLYIVTNDGSRWNYVHEVTAQMHNAEDRTHIHIILDELPIPDIGDNGNDQTGGFIPSFEEWQNVEIGIQM